MTHLVFLENQAQVSWTKQSLPLDSKVKLVAVTAEALQALEECGLPHEAISAYADTRQLASVEEQFNLDSFALAEEIESFIGQRYAPARFDGPGFLSGQGYYIQYSVSAIATRAFLMRETIRACSPKVVTVFGGDIDPWFLGDGYARNPWLDVVEGLAEEYGFQLEVLLCPAPQPEVLPGPTSETCSVSANLRRFPRCAYRYAIRKTLGLIRRLSPIRLFRLLFVHTSQATTIHFDDLDGLRLLMANSLGYDWGPVLKALQSIKGVECFAIASLRLDKREWTPHYAPTMHHVWNKTKYELGIGSPQIDETEVQTISCLFDDWLRQRPTPPELNVLGMKLFPALATHLRAVTCLSPALARHADAVASRALEIASPHAVCFFAMPWLTAKRLAFQCRQQGISVVCYQHGPVYGTHISAKNEQADPAHADYFLTYGTGIQPRANAAFPVRARYVPVGSSRIESMTAKPPPLSEAKGVINVLWIAEFSTRNTYGSSIKVEDTERYLFQKQCLRILGSADNLRVIYRPYKQQVAWDGTTHWIERAHLRSVRTNSTKPLDELIRIADIVISDNSSGTVWNEVVALKKPLILYCDPRQTRLSPHFAADLERACYWCKSREELVAAVRRLAVEGATFVAELQQIDTTAFIRRYVLHRDDGQCVQRVVSFLNAVCRNGQSVDDWESSMLTGT